MPISHHAGSQLRYYFRRNLFSPDPRNSRAPESPNASCIIRLPRVHSFPVDKSQRSLWSLTAAGLCAFGLFFSIACDNGSSGDGGGGGGGGGGGPPPCAGVGLACNTTGDCCQGLCVGGFCKPSGTQCIPNGRHCDSTAECCGGIAVCNGDRVCDDLSGKCVPPGRSCGASLRLCCGLSSCVDGFCDAGLGCIGVGGHCQNTAECCGLLLCSSGICF